MLARNFFCFYYKLFFGETVIFVDIVISRRGVCSGGLSPNLRHMTSRLSTCFERPPSCIFVMNAVERDDRLNQVHV